MTKRSDTWMPLYIGDYLADTSRLTTEQHGAYLLLLMDYWRNGPPPDDEDTLAAIAKLPVSAWRKCAPRLQPFFSVEDGQWRQKRMDAEREKAAGIGGKRKAAGAAGAAKRWGKGDGKLCEALGFKQPELFFPNPEQTPAQPPAPDPKLVEAQNRHQVEMLRLQIEREKAQADTVDVYISDFGTVKAVPNRFQRPRTAFAIQSDMWAVAVLRPMSTTPLAKTGDSDRRQLLTEFTLEARQEKSSGAVRDLL
ncbi:SU10 major capsid protein [Pseudaquabacterium rugosum]|uniref:DUF5309 family protein n=1 Tax=Pseudaquabacterium rugosum TaxID=2984194 RepID=A0ABU9B579_9BURK